MVATSRSGWPLYDRDPNVRRIKTHVLIRRTCFANHIYAKVTRYNNYRDALLVLDSSDRLELIEEVESEIQ